MLIKFRYCLIFFFIIFLSVQSYSQFISNKGKTSTSYLNYSGRNYENYSSTFLRKKFFDNFGNFLVEGTTVYELSEVQKQLGASEIPTGNSDLIKSRYYQNYFNNLVIANDSYSGFETRLMVGDAIRTKFTSLTLNRARFNGIRWDAGTPKYRGTLVASRISDPIRFRFDNPIYIDGVRRIRDWTQYLFGGHFETDIGDILTLGLTYVNQHQRKSSSQESSLKGVVSNVIPRVIFLRISDESPGDNSGPIIFSTPTIIINGQPKQLVNIFNTNPTAASTQLNQPIQYWILRYKLEGSNRGFDISDKGIFRGQDTTSFTRLINYKNAFAENPSKYVYPFRVPSSETESMTYGFLIPPGAESVQFQITVANDYKIETAQDYLNTKDDYTSPFFSHADDQLLAQLTPFFIRARADGNVRDGSNKRIVTINYGLTTGMSVYGLNFQFKWSGFDIEGEFNESVEFMKYPLLAGNRFESKGKAWYLRGKKKIGRFTFGGERYQITPTYITWLNTYVLENSYYASPTSDFIPNPRAATGEPFADFLGYDATYTPSRIVLFPGGAFYPLVDDNDDDDRWEDGFYHYHVVSTDIFNRNNDVINKNGDYFKLGYRQNTNELRSLEDIVRRPDAGIFPGKDRDNDGIPDDDRNANGIPDYSEDFLTYYADPPTFDYGDDWNNNGIIDEQENDILPDYPYEPDIDGYHVFSNLDLLDGLNFGVGKIYEEAIARGGRNDVNYLKAGYFTSTPKFGELRLYYILKQARDNIPNDLYLFKGVITTRNPFPEYVVDPLNYRNSLVNSLYIGTKYTQIKNLLIENNIRFELNKQFSIGARENAFLTPTEVRLLGDQVPGRVVFWGIVNKIDYTFRFFNDALKISPQFKIRTEKVVKFSEDRQRNSVVEIQQHNQEVIPIVRLDYRLTENTDVRFGVQGFSMFGDFFKYKIRNYKDGVESQDRAIVAFSISNKTQYAGYNVVFDFGYKYTDINYLREVDKSKGNQESSFFFSIYAGF